MEKELEDPICTCGDPSSMHIDGCEQCFNGDCGCREFEEREEEIPQFKGTWEQLDSLTPTKTDKKMFTSRLHHELEDLIPTKTENAYKIEYTTPVKVETFSNGGTPTITSDKTEV